MLLMLMTLPVPRVTIPAQMRRRGGNGALTLEANIAFEGRERKVSVGPNTENPALLTRMSDVAHFLGETRNARGVGEVSATKWARPPCN